MAQPAKTRKPFIILAVAGILFDLIVIALMASERISVKTAMMLLVLGVLLAFIPIAMMNVKPK